MIKLKRQNDKNRQNFKKANNKDIVMAKAYYNSRTRKGE